LYWTSVNDIAGTFSDLLIVNNNNPYPIYHVDHPIGQSWKEMNGYSQAALKISNLIPLHDWLERVRQTPQQNNSAVMLSEFLESNYLRISCGGLVLDISNTLEHSATLKAASPVSGIVLREYIHSWKEIEFLQTTAEDRARFENEKGNYI
jgi:hypothetical protein